MCTVVAHGAVHYSCASCVPRLVAVVLVLWCPWVAVARCACCGMLSQRCMLTSLLSLQYFVANAPELPNLFFLVFVPFLVWRFHVLPAQTCAAGTDVAAFTKKARLLRFCMLFMAATAVRCAVLHSAELRFASRRSVACCVWRACMPHLLPMRCCTPLRLHLMPAETLLVAALCRRPAGHLSTIYSV